MIHVIWLFCSAHLHTLTYSLVLNAWQDNSKTFQSTSKALPASVNWIMQLYHHPYSLDSQKVRLALEEKGIDYTSHHVNPITGKNMDTLFFKMNPSAKLPIFQNGAHIIFDTIEIIQYVSSFAFPFCYCCIECMRCFWIWKQLQN